MPGEFFVRNGLVALADSFITGSLFVTGSIVEFVPILTQTASYTAQLSDRGDLIEMNSTSSNFFTIPSSSVVTFPIGSKIDVVQYGTGQTIITSGSTGVVLRSAGGRLKLTSQYSSATVIQRALNEWYVIGDLSL